MYQWGNKLNQSIIPLYYQSSNSVWCNLSRFNSSDAFCGTQSFRDRGEPWTHLTPGLWLSENSSGSWFSTLKSGNPAVMVTRTVVESCLSHVLDYAHLLNRVGTNTSQQACSLAWDSLISSKGTQKIMWENWLQTSCIQSFISSWYHFICFPLSQHVET